MPSISARYHREGPKKKQAHTATFPVAEAVAAAAAEAAVDAADAPAALAPTAVAPVRGIEGVQIDPDHC